MGEPAKLHQLWVELLNGGFPVVLEGETEPFALVVFRGPNAGWVYDWTGRADEPPARIHRATAELLEWARQASEAAEAGLKDLISSVAAELGAVEDRS